MRRAEAHSDEQVRRQSGEDEETREKEGEGGRRKMPRVLFLESASARATSSHSLSSIIGGFLKYFAIEKIEIKIETE